MYREGRINALHHLTLKKKEGVTVKKYYIFKNIFNNKEETNV
jgi:hypothetical protein